MDTVRMYSSPARTQVDEQDERSEGQSGRRSPTIASAPPAAPRLLDALRERLRYMHYSLRTEEAYVCWVRGFVRWAGGQRHPREMGATEVQAFLSMLANERHVAAATHRQALSALLFLYREVLGIDMPWLQQLGRPVPHKRIPVVLTHVEVQALLARMSENNRSNTKGAGAGAGTRASSETGLLAQLLYGTGMRLLEGVRLRVKDVDLVRQVIVVRDGKGGKDRVVMLPRALDAPLRAQLQRAHRLWQQDRDQGRAGVYLPHALAAKYTRAAESWSWFWVFPAASSATIRAAPAEAAAAMRRFSTAITCTRSACSATSMRPFATPASPSRRRCTPCATRSPPTCSRPAPTSAPCSNCSATPTSARP